MGPSKSGWGDCAVGPFSAMSNPRRLAWASSSLPNDLRSLLMRRHSYAYTHLPTYVRSPVTLQEEQGTIEFPFETASIT